MKISINQPFLLIALAAAINLSPRRLSAESFTTVFTTLHSFTATSNYTNSDGANPIAKLIPNSSGSILYGTAAKGGSSGAGTIFAVNTDGTGFTNLYYFTATSINFSGNPTNGDGAAPRGGLLLSGNTLYGTTVVGGLSGNGTVFAVNIDGTGFTNLHSFAATRTNSSGLYTNSDGANPQAALILSGNTLYGTAGSGGDYSYGTVFAVNTDGTGFTTLHSFTANSGYPGYTNSDGANPEAALILSSDDILYGTASNGGDFAAGTVFALSTDGSGFRNLHSFPPVAYDFRGGYTNDGGAHPEAELILSGGTLYGTSYQGGSGGVGTIFAINTDGTAFTNLHSLDFSDGSAPNGLTLSSNTLYGTSYQGGAGYGTVFSLQTNGTGFTILHNFTATSGGGYTGPNGDGAHPDAGLMLLNNTLYGTAVYGGTSGSGTLFSLLVRPPITFKVTSIADSGPGTLRDFLASAAGGDVIDASGVSGVILLTSGELLISNSVSIIGPGPANLSVDGNAAGFVFHIAPSKTVTLASLTITNGRGGIYNEYGALTVSNCSVRGNSASSGGGIFNNGSAASSGSASLQIVNSTISGNSAANYGGGIYNDARNAGNAYLSIVNSTVSGNSASFGGGIHTRVGNVFVSFCYPRNPPCDRYGYATSYLVNSTISGNSATKGGGIYNGFDSFNSPPGGQTFLSVASSTFSGNSGGAIYSDAPSDNATLEIGNTILSAGTSGANILWQHDINGISGPYSDGYNLSSDAGDGVLIGPSDQINTNPLLGPLQDNGGPTFTHAPLPGSPAIDQGLNYSGATDQRGFERTVDLNIANAGDGTDIGAVEMAAALRFRNYAVVSSRVGFDIIGKPGQVVAVDVSTNLLSWTGLTTNTLGASPFTFTDPTLASSPQRFYRARVQ